MESLQASGLLRTSSPFQSLLTALFAPTLILYSKMMFSRFAALSLAALPVLAAATPLEKRQDCSTGPIQCCNQVQSVRRAPSFTHFFFDANACLTVQDCRLPEDCRLVHRVALP